MLLDRSDEQGVLAVFINSSDNTRDVFELVSQSIDRFWPRCPYPIYVGQNTLSDKGMQSKFRPVLAQTAGWQQELHDQIAQLREEFVLLLLDDFLILKPVDDDRLSRLLAVARQQNTDYLRLIEIERGWIVKATSRLVSRLRGEEIVRIPLDIPYYSSLQATIWRREYLLDMLRRYSGKTIWGFEHFVLPDHVHYAAADHAPIRYRHLVEKGRWLPDAERLLKKRGIEFISGRRAHWPAYYKIRMYADRLKFAIIGYGWMRLKRKLFCLKLDDAA